METFGLSSENLTAFYRYAFLLTGDAPSASEELASTLQQGAGNMTQFRNTGQRNAWIERKLREHCSNPKPARSIASDEVPQAGAALARSFQLLLPVERSCLALFYLDLLSPAEIAANHGITLEQLAEILTKARANLQRGETGGHPVSMQNQHPLTSLHRADSSNDSHVRKAVRRAEKDDSTRVALDEQTGMDGRMRLIVADIALPEDLTRKLTSMEEARGAQQDWRRTLKQPPFLAAALGVVVLLCLMIFLWTDRKHNFPGKESVQRMIERNDELGSAGFEPMATAAGNLDDWFFGKGLGKFSLPSEFAAYKTEAVRTFRLEGKPVAQVAIEEHEMLLYLFQGEDFGVKLVSPQDWFIFEEGEWAAAIRQENENCIMVAFKGSSGDMKKFLDEGRQKQP